MTPSFFQFVFQAFTQQLHCISFQGCWFITIAEIMAPVYHEKQFADNHHSLMTVEIIFVSEMLALKCVCVLVGTLAYFKVKRMSLTRVSTALDIEYLLVKKQSTTKPLGNIYSDITFQPFVNSNDEKGLTTWCIIFSFRWKVFTSL